MLSWVTTVYILAVWKRVKKFIHNQKFEDGNPIGCWNSNIINLSDDNCFKIVKNNYACWKEFWVVCIDEGVSPQIRNLRTMRP